VFRALPRGSRVGLWLRGAGLTALAAGGLLLFPHLWTLVTDREQLEAWLAAPRTMGALLLIGLNALQVIVAPLPGALLGWISGYWFGPWWGSLFTWIGVSLGNGLTMAFARILGRPLLLAGLPAHRLERMDRLLQRYGLSLVLIVFLLPLTPDDVLAWAVGLSPLPLGPAFAVSTLARLVHVLITNAVGAYLRSGDPLWLGMAASLSLGALALAWRLSTAARLPLSTLYDDRLA
jgi:uncharacterized membrane protein YdjX (TVP38/TMEM64 family)